MPQLEHVTAQVDRLTAFDAGPFPLISLYLNLQPNERGRDSFEPFLRKELADRLRTYPANGPERDRREPESQTSQTRRLGTGAFPAARRELSPSARERGGRQHRANRPRRADRSGDRRSRRGHSAAAAGALPERPGGPDRERRHA